MFPRKKICSNALRSICLCLVAVAGHGQDQATINDFNLKTMLPTSPEAVMLGKFGEIPVGHYTGTADISIPLHNIVESGFEVPITLRYHASGIKVQEEASNVGLGWLLEPGGAITEIVNGSPDYADQLASTQGYSYLKQKVSISSAHMTRRQIGTRVFTDCSSNDNYNFDDTNSDSPSIKDRLFDWQDGQPDIYQYSFPGGYSGKFIRHPETGEIIILDKKEQIKFVGGTNGWIATTLDGNRFYFEAHEYSYTFQSNYNNGSTWKLTKILLNSGKEISFSYEDGGYTSTVYNETFQTRISWDSSPEFPQPYTNYTHHYTKRLSQIVSSTAIVDFKYEDRDDMFGKPDNDGDASNGELSVKRIKRVEVTSAVDGTKLKSFSFAYDYFAYSNVGGNLSGQPTNPDPRYGKRLKLLSVQEFGHNGTSSFALPPHRFEYNESVVLPMKFSRAVDYWGYYNGMANNGLIPDITLLKLFGYYGLDFPMDRVYHVFDGVRRESDTVKIKAAMLQRIYYPTGGMTEFTYEINSFRNYKYVSLQDMNAMRRIVDVTDRNGEGIPILRFPVMTTQVVKISNRLSRGSATSLDYDDLEPSRIKLYRIVNGTYTELKEWKLLTSDRESFDMTGSKSWEEYIQLDGGPGVEYMVNTDLNGTIGYQGYSGATAWTNLTYFEPSEMSLCGRGGGLRVSAVTSYDKDGSFAGQKKFNYKMLDGSSSGLLMSRIEPAAIRRIKYSKRLTTFGGPAPDVHEWYIRFVDEWFLTSESYVPYSNAANGNLVGYGRVEEISVDRNGLTQGKKVLTFRNVESVTSPDMPADPYVGNGLIDTETLYHGNNSVLQQRRFVYDERDISYVTGTKIRKQYVDFTVCLLRKESEPECGYLYMHYPITSRWIYPSYTITTKEAGGIQNIVREDYDYNNFGQQDEVTSTTSTGKSTVVKTLFAKNTFDGETTTTGEQFADGELLYNNKLFDLPLEKRYFVDDVLQYKTLYFYDEIGGQVVNTRIERVFGAGAAFNVVSFDKYGPNKTLREVTQKGIKSSLIYDNTNSYVIASASNAASTEIAYTSFEPQESGGWTFSDSKTNKLTARTGSWQYALNTNAVSYSGLSSGKKYIVSYWSQNSSPYTVSGTVGTAAKLMTADGWNYFEHTITGVTQVTVSGSGFLDELRLHPADAQMTSYTSEPLKGVSSVSDPASRAAFFDFDANGRLETMRGNSKEVMKVMDYHYSTN